MRSNVIYLYYNQTKERSQKRRKVEQMNIAYELRIEGKETRLFNTLENAQNAAKNEKEYKIYKVELVEEKKHDPWDDVKAGLKDMSMDEIKSVCDSVKPKSWN